MSESRRLGTVLAIAGLACIATMALPGEAEAWWCCGVRVGVFVPPIVIAPPVYAPPPVWYPPPAYYAPPTAYYAPPQRAWVPAHWQGNLWVPAHWG